MGRHAGAVSIGKSATSILPVRLTLTTLPLARVNQTDFSVGRACFLRKFLQISEVIH